MLLDPAKLPPYADEVNGRRKVDVHIVLFAVNMFFVLLGYYFAIRFNALGVIKVVRIVLMGISLAGLLLFWRPKRFKVSRWRHTLLALFILANLLIIPFAAFPEGSLERLLTVVPFWVYTNVFAYYLRGRYGATDGLRRIVWMLLVVYLFPMLAFYLHGNPFARFNIYGDESSGFVSNHLGWSSAIVLACLIDARGTLAKARWGAIIWWVGMGAGLWLLLISGSRSSYLSLAATVLLLLTSTRTLQIIPKVFIGLCVLASVYVLVNVQDSAINRRVKKTKDQLEQIEPRLLSAQQAFHTLNLHEERYITGIGFDMYRESLIKLNGVSTYRAHNSYLELFVNCGAIVFAIFFFALLLPTLVRFGYYDASQFSFLPPILIIPYFENNLGAGQFLFFPWMLMLFWYMHDVRWGRSKIEN